MSCKSYDTAWLEKVYESPHLQIYVDHALKHSSKNKYYTYIYRYLDNDKINMYESDYFPHDLLNVSVGYLFTTVDAEIPMLPTFRVHDYPTNFVNLSNAFVGNKTADTAIRVRPGYHCHPSCTTDFTMVFELSSAQSIPKDDIINQYISVQPSFKNVCEWKEWIYDNCPIQIQYPKVISNKTIKEPITAADMAIDYDIHSPNEFEIVCLIERTFENMNQTVRVLDNYNHIVKRIIKACDKLNIKYTSSETPKHTKLKYKHKPNNNRLYGIKWVSLKYSDLLKCGIEYSLTDFIS